jgi:branched-subunit amino acid transport protein
MSPFVASDFGLWSALIAACVGTYICRAIGVKLAGHIDQESEIFRWLSAVTYAMVAALTIRLIVMPVGMLATVPLLIRITICGLSIGVMVSSPTRRLVPALLTGILSLVIYGYFK